MSEKTLIDQWRAIGYDETANKGDLQRFWAAYFNTEKEIYIQLLQKPEDVAEGTLQELAERFEIKPVTMAGFLDGINDSLKVPYTLEEITEDTPIRLEYDKERLYKNMVDAKADWLYELPEWDTIFDEDKKKELYVEQKKSGTVVKAPKIGRNDPCPCGSGKKYKKCCGK
ncbi:MAG: SEC-C metal-binding domain-containing protein [Lachnospiraceae bacterium]